MPVSPDGEVRAIITIQQLPDSRRAILIALKRRGSATIAELAAELAVTGEAVRQQLLQLHRDGWIESSVERRENARMGRPAAGYRLSIAGDHLFPKHYDALAIAVMDAVADELGAAAVLHVLARVANDRVASMEPALRELPLPARVDALRSWYLADDPHMEVEVVGEDFRLIERNCPFLNTALRRPALCSISVHALSRILGVHVEREERFQNGDGRCVFRIRANQPAPADSPFELEPSTQPRPS